MMDSSNSKMQGKDGMSKSTMPNEMKTMHEEAKKHIRNGHAKMKKNHGADIPDMMMEM